MGEVLLLVYTNFHLAGNWYKHVSKAKTFFTSCFKLLNDGLSFLFAYIVWIAVIAFSGFATFI